MESHHKVIVIIGLALVLTAGYFVAGAYIHSSDVKLEKFKVESEVEKEKEKTKQLGLIAEIANKSL